MAGPPSGQALQQVLERAFGAHQRGQFAEAEQCYRAYLAQRPHHPDAQYMFGVLYFQQERLREAQTHVALALKLRPNWVEALLLDGLIEQRQNRPAAAVARFEEALALRSDYVEALVGRGNALDALGRQVEALASYDRARALALDDVTIHYNRGNVLRSLERNDEALASFERALVLAPGNVQTLANRGEALLALKRPREALTSIELALTLAPDDAGIHYNRGNALRALERNDEALASFERALALAPGDVRTLANRGETLLALKRPREALTSIELALAQQSDNIEALINRGVALTDLGRDQDALVSYERALTLRPDAADALSNRGLLLSSLGRPDEALASYDRALAVRPDDAGTWVKRGNCLHAMNRWREALQSYDAALARAPGDGKARFAACMGQLLALYADEAEIAERRAAYAERLGALAAAEDDPELARGVGAHQPFYLAYQGGDDRELQAVYGKLVCRLMAQRYPAVQLAEPAAAGEPVRVGIVSGYFSNHSNWKIPIKGWLARLDREKFHVSGYYTNGKRDTETEAAASLCRRFVQGPRSIEQWRAEIGADRQHVLIYPEVGMDPVCAELAAQRLAPVQCNSWGHPDTSGFPTLDYFLSSDLMEPPGAEALYTERLIRLPNLSIWYDPPALPLPPTPRAELGLRADATVYWCGQSLYKYLPQYDTVFARIARNVPDCQFAFIAHLKSPQVTETFRARLARAFAALGLRAEDHCLFWPPRDMQHFMAAIAACDIVLDSIGWSGCNSTLESLPAGLPIVTMPGNFMRGRHTTAILKMMDVTETIAATLDDYVATAVRLAHDRAWRGAVKNRMSANRDRVYRDETCIAALQEFLSRVAQIA
jgi:predicted O-linked N-acetylglucosamine transferase (SPINDLY family)